RFFSIRDWASAGLAFALLFWAVLLTSPLTIGYFKLSEREQLLARREEAFYSVTPERLNSIIIGELRARPRYFDQLVEDIIRQVGESPSPETIRLARLQVANFIDGKYVGIITRGDDVGKVGLLVEPPFTNVPIVFATNRSPGNYSETTGATFTSG